MSWYNFCCLLKSLPCYIITIRFILFAALFFRSRSSSDTLAVLRPVPSNIFQMLGTKTLPPLKKKKKKTLRLHSFLWIRIPPAPHQGQSQGAPLFESLEVMGNGMGSAKTATGSPLLEWRILWGNLMTTLGRFGVEKSSSQMGVCWLEGSKFKTRWKNDPESVVFLLFSDGDRKD